MIACRELLQYSFSFKGWGKRENPTHARKTAEQDQSRGKLHFLVWFPLLLVICVQDDLPGNTLLPHPQKAGCPCGILMTQPARRTAETNRAPVLRSRTGEESPRSLGWLMVRWLVVKTEGLWEGFGFQGEILPLFSYPGSACLCHLFFFNGYTRSLLLCGNCSKQELLSSCDVWASYHGCFSHCGAQNPGSMGSGSCETWVPRLQSTGLAVMVHGLGCFEACGILPDQGPNLCLLPWPVDSLPLSHQGRRPCATF